jgi:hypothetical protein
MNFELLCSALQEAAPSQKVLKDLGLSDEEAREFTSSFNVIPRNDNKAVMHSADIIQDFFTQYDPSNLEVGMIRFLSMPKTIDRGRIIGYVEADTLVVDKSTGKVFVDDLTSPGNTLWECADSIEQFLFALVPAASYLGLCLVDDDDKVRTNKLLSKNVLEKCVSIAGGSSYESFFRMLLGME